MLGHVANSAAPYATGNNLREARARDKITQNSGFGGSLPEARLGTTTVQYKGVGERFLVGGSTPPYSPLEGGSTQNSHPLSGGES